MSIATLLRGNKEAKRYEDHPSYWDLRALKSDAQVKRIDDVYKVYKRIMFVSLCLTALLNIEYHEGKTIKVLKTDLWNEGIECATDVISMINNISNRKILFYGMDISHYVAAKAVNRLRYISAVQSSITHIPFRSSFFDAIFDLSTIDHVSHKYRKNIIKEYFRCLKPKGILLLIADTSNIYSRLAKTLPSKRISKLLAHSEDSLPEYPSIMRARVKEYFNIVQEGCVGLAYPVLKFLFSGRKSRVFKTLLNRIYVYKVLYSVGSSGILRKMSFLCRQYFLICRRK